MELVKLEFLGSPCPWVMISEVLLISKSESDKSWCFGISWCFRFLLLGVLEEFKDSFVAANSNNPVNINNLGLSQML